MHRAILGTVLAGAISACATALPRTEAQQLSDAEAASTVEATLNADPRIYARHIDVTVEEGIVHLSGFVWSSSEEYYAKADAAHVPGVVGVANELELMRGGRTGSGGH